MHQMNSNCDPMRMAGWPEDCQVFHNAAAVQSACAPFLIALQLLIHGFFHDLMSFIDSPARLRYHAMLMHSRCPMVQDRG